MGVPGGIKGQRSNTDGEGRANGHFRVSRELCRMVDNADLELQICVQLADLDC